MLWAWLLPFLEAVFVPLLLAKAYVLNPKWKQPFIMKRLRTLLSSLKVLFNLMSRHLILKTYFGTFWLGLLPDARNKISHRVPRINCPALLFFLPTCRRHTEVIKCWHFWLMWVRTKRKDWLKKHFPSQKLGIKEISEGRSEIKSEWRKDELQITDLETSLEFPAFTHEISLPV